MPDAAIRSMNPRTTAPSQLGERQFSNVDIRARAESVEPFDRTRNGSASSNSIGSPSICSRCNSNTIRPTDNFAEQEN